MAGCQSPGGSRAERMDRTMTLPALWIAHRHPVVGSRLVRSRGDHHDLLPQKISSRTWQSRAGAARDRDHHPGLPTNADTPQKLLTCPSAALPPCHRCSWFRAALAQFEICKPFGGKRRPADVIGISITVKTTWIATGAESGEVAQKKTPRRWHWAGAGRRFRQGPVASLSQQEPSGARRKLEELCRSSRSWTPATSIPSDIGSEYVHLKALAL